MKKAHILLSTVLVVSLGAAWAQAQEGLDSERFKPAMDSQGLILTEGGQGEDPFDFNAGLYLHYARNPMVIRDGGDIIHSLVAHRFSGNLMGSVGLTKWFTVGVDIPVVFFQTGVLLNEGAGEDVTSTAMGDIRAGLKFTGLREKSHGISLAVHVPVSLPTGDDRAFVGSSTVSASPAIAASRHFLEDRLLLAVNLGLWLQGEGSYQELEVGHELFYRIGLGFNFAENVWALGEIAAAGKLENLFSNKPEETPFEWILALRYHGLHDLVLTAGGAVGSLPGWGTPNFRAFLGVSWAPRDRDQDGDGISDSEDRCPADPGPRENGGCPWGDQDGDGLKDNEDKCPREAGPPENGGCPWGDRDGDGVNDNVDKCPTEAGPKENGGCPWGDKDQDGIRDNEDKCPELAGPAENGGCPYHDADGDGVKDSDDKCPDEPGPPENDGCPWGDQDEDGILDNLDKCPKEAEDKDGFEDEDGCPDKDNDKDGIPDEKDKCPDEPETINGVEDEDGCPDEGKQVVIVKKEKIEILQKVHFAYGRAKIRPDSHGLLNQVAQVIQAHREIRKIRVEGHTDSRGTEEYNQRLSQRRADAVKAYLIKRGVDPARLESLGYGESRPIASNHTVRGRESNRRVEFTIIEKQGD